MQGNKSFLYIADLVRKKQRNRCFFPFLSLGPTVVNGDTANEDEACKDEFELMSIDKIINGKVRFAQFKIFVFWSWSSAFVTT